MENHSRWTAKLSLGCFFALVGGTLIGALLVGLALLSMGIDVLDPPFPIALVSLPVNEAIVVGVTILLARYKSAGLKELGLKKISVKTFTIVSVIAMPLFFLAIGVSLGVEVVFGPDPMAEEIAEAVTPRNPIQLVAMILISLVLVGPCEELAARGFIQKGFENSFGKRKGLLIASLLFGLWHGLNAPSAVIPVFVVALVFGYTWQRTGGNTTASALMHGVYDSIAISVVYFLGL